MALELLLALYRPVWSPMDHRRRWDVSVRLGHDWIVDRMGVWEDGRALADGGFGRDKLMRSEKDSES